MGAHLDPQRFEQASGAERAALVAHAAGCAACRDQLAERDPALLFALLATRPIPRAALDSVSENVLRHLPAGRPSWIEAVRLRGASRRLAAAAVLAVALAAGSFVWRGPGRPLPAPATLAGGSQGGVAFVESSGPARIVDMTVGETQIVMIFDPEMKL